MLRETGTTPKQQELIDTVVASTGTMVEVVNELTMETAGNMTSEPRGEIRFKLGPTIQDTIELMKLNKRHLQSLIVYDDKGEGAKEYNGDPIIIKQILIDLLSAAISGTTRQDHNQNTGQGGRYSRRFAESRVHPVVKQPCGVHR